jgi:hypothetical protein
MLTHRLHTCAQAGCSALTIRRHCEAHEDLVERELRRSLDLALVDYVTAEEAYVGAVRADVPADVVETLEPLRAADQRVRVLEAELGMVR